MYCIVQTKYLYNKKIFRIGSKTNISCYYYRKTKVHFENFNKYTVFMFKKCQKLYDCFDLKC